MSLTLTDEQRAIVEACRSGARLTVEAGAGTGKTSTLRAAAEAMRGRRGVYLAYNRLTAQDAHGTFPAGVVTSTAHSAAFRSLGHRYARRLSAAGAQTSRQQADLLGIYGRTYVTRSLGLTPGQLARLAMGAVKQFCQSDRRELVDADVPTLPGVTGEAHAALVDVVLPWARAAWADLQHDDEAGRGQLRFAHDHYLKLWALTDPYLQVDYLMFDEAQDANPVIEAIVRRQTHAQVIAVGDSAQQLYAWRGAVDALARFPADARLQLTQSWRFGPAIADEANKWLELLGSTMRLVGAPGQPSRVGPFAGWPDAVLCRTNAAAFGEALEAMTAGLRVGMAGGGRKIQSLAEACRELQNGQTTGHPELFVFSSWGEVRDYVEDANDAGDLRALVSIIDDHGADAVIAAARRLVDLEGRDRTAPVDLIVSTGHKAKGREWRAVRVGGDYVEPTDPAGRPGPVERAECNAAYVTVTRAREFLDRAGLEYVDRRVAGLTRMSA